MLTKTKVAKHQVATRSFCDGCRHGKYTPFQQSEELTVLTAAVYSARLIDTNEQYHFDSYLEKSWFHTSAIKNAQHSSPANR